MIEIVQTDNFSEWLEGLRDRRAKTAIEKRLDRVALGNFGDVSSVGSGVNEMRVHIGAGYRIYFIHRGKTVIVLLCGGDKGSQSRDIVRAHELAVKIEDILEW